jgi:hypothetical protein
VPQLAVRLTQIVPAVNELVFNDLQKIGYDCKAALRSFGKPVLIIQGREDIIREETARVAQSVLPQSKVVLMEKCGHYGWLDQPGIYYAELFGFLEVVPLQLSLKDSTLFDFWVGDWDLSWTNANGTPGKGTNLIEKILDGKVIRENFAADSGFKGTSISVFQAGTQSWRQAWADNQGGYFDFEAKLEGMNRVFQTRFRDLANGQKAGGAHGVSQCPARWLHLGLGRQLPTAARAGTCNGGWSISGGDGGLFRMNGRMPTRTDA